MYPRVGAAPKWIDPEPLWRGDTEKITGCPLPSTRLGNEAWHSSCSSANSWETAYGILYFLTDTFWVSAGCVKIYWLVCGTDTLYNFYCCIVSGPAGCWPTATGDLASRGLGGRQQQRSQQEKEDLFLDFFNYSTIRLVTKRVSYRLWYKYRAILHT